jgi:hypothetical protein
MQHQVSSMEMRSSVLMIVSDLGIKVMLCEMLFLMAVQTIMVLLMEMLFLTVVAVHIQILAL